MAQFKMFFVSCFRLLLLLLLLLLLGFFCSLFVCLFVFLGGGVVCLFVCFLVLFCLFFCATSSLCRELSPTRTFNWPGCSCVQITYNTLGTHHVTVEHVVRHVVHRDSSAIKSDRVGLAFISD